MKPSHNFNLLLLISLGVLLGLSGEWVGNLLNIPVPFSVAVVAFYLLLSFTFAKYGFSFFLIFTYPLLGIYLSYITYHRVEVITVWQVLNTPRPALLLYTFLMLPSLFFGYTGDFFELTNEVTSLKGGKYFRLILSVLLRREMILHRFDSIRENLQFRGIDINGFLGRYVHLPLWLVPLFITSLFEGVELYDYNVMLKTNILAYTPEVKTTRVTPFQQVALSAVTFLIILRLATWLYIWSN